MDCSISNYLVPSDAALVRKTIQNAYVSSKSQAFLESHFVTVAYAAATFVISLLNVLTYIAYGIGRAVKNLCDFKICKIAESLLYLVLGVIQSALLVVICAVSLPFIFFFPCLVFMAFKDERRDNPPTPPPPQQPPQQTPPQQNPPGQADPLNRDGDIVRQNVSQLDLNSVLRAFSPQPPPLDSLIRNGDVIRLNLSHLNVHADHLLDYIRLRKPPEPCTTLICDPHALPRYADVMLSDNNRVLIDLSQAGITREMLQQVMDEISPREVLMKGVERDDMVQISPSAVSKIPKGNILNYVTHHCPSYINDFQSLIGAGEAFYKMFQTTTKGALGSPEQIPLDQRRSYAAPFTWYIMSLAEDDQGKAFEEGMFTFQDPGHRIHDFFEAVASKRLSSHYSKTRITSYGIDIRQDGTTGLPSQHQTMHFGKVKLFDHKEYTFLKPESWGTESLWQIIGHGVSYLLTRPAHFFGTPSSAGMYKEHTSKSQVRDFLKLRAELEPKATAKAPTEQGTGFMIIYLRDFLKNESNSIHKEKIWKFVKDYFPPEMALSTRTGNEVFLILDSQEREKELERLRAPYRELLTLLLPYSYNQTRVMPPSEVDRKSDY